MISLLNYLGTISEKLLIDIPAKCYEVNYILHKSQMGFRKQRSTIDVVPRMFNKMQEA